MGDLAVKEGEADVKAFLKIMDVATAVRQQREQVSKHLDIEEQKKDIIKRLKATYEVTGEKLTDEEIEAAIDSFFSGLYSFKEPEKDFSYKLAEKYIDRGRIFRTYVAPGLVAAGVITVTVLGALAIRSSYKHGQEEKVEKAVEQAYKRKNIFERQIKGLQANDAAGLDKIVSEAFITLSNTGFFFQNYCPEGVADKHVTQENYKEVGEKLENVKASLISVEYRLKKGSELVSYEQGLVSEKKTLDLQIKEIRDMKPPWQLKKKAEMFYSEGIVAVESRELEQARQYSRQLAEIKTSTQKFAVLPDQVEKLYTSIKSVAKEDKAIETANGYYKDAQTHIESGDVDLLNASVLQLKDLDALLRQEYTLRIVSRRGVKSGIDRYYTDERGRRASGHYLILEAVNSRGQTMPIRIMNEENGRTQAVNMWGERVPNAVYERVKRDKLDNGIINNNIFGKKQKGYLEPVVIMEDTKGKILERAGQITRW